MAESAKTSSPCQIVKAVNRSHAVAIVKLFRDGTNIRAIARIYGLSWTGVEEIVRVYGWLRNGQKVHAR